MAPVFLHMHTEVYAWVLLDAVSSFRVARVFSTTPSSDPAPSGGGQVAGRLGWASSNGMKQKPHRLSGCSGRMIGLYKISVNR